MSQPTLSQRTLLQHWQSITSTAVRAGLTSLLAGFALAAGASTSEFELDNGLKLIVQEDHRAPVAVVQVWYRVGSSYEHDGITGVSHALEHMMFKGTEKLEPGEFSRIVSQNGGEENAFTSYDYTAYFQQWSASNVDLSFELEAERMRHLKLSEEEFAKEINVVLEERRLRTDDNPRARAGEAVRAAAFQTSPYRNPVIGWASDIQEMELEDLAAWYQRWYAPNNAIVVVVGDVRPQEVFESAKRHFGDFKPEKLKAPKRRPEVPQQGTKRLLMVDEDARLPYLTMAYKAPVLTEVEEADIEEWEVYALEVLAATLDGNKASRLPKKLVRRDRVASSVSVSYSMANRLRTLFSISATPADGRSPEELEQAIRAELEALRKAPPSAAELARIKTQVVADSLFEQDSPFYQGIIIGSLEAIGLDWRLRDDYVSNIEKVTPEQVQAVARKYLVDDTLTVATLVPGPALAMEAAQ